MMKNTLPTLSLPASGKENENVEISHTGSVVLIGANGSGKSRLGAWIEKNSQTLVHRISAQRALDVPEYTQLKSLEQSNNDLLWGNENSAYASAQYKFSHRWGNRPETFMQNDYGKVLSSLFAASAERDRKHTSETAEKQCYVPVDDAPIDKLIRLWKAILPHRLIGFEDGKVVVKNNTNSLQYHGKDMSDGERVALYLMGQVLSTPPGSILIIDEPEIHLHSSIMQSMWDQLEEEKSDSLFVYITHDLNFASTRMSSSNIWVKDFDGNNVWNWEPVPEINEIPESLVLELLGNRRKIIFVEGEKGGKDHAIYQSIYKNFNVVPRNGCESVIASTKALKANAAFHHIEAFGLIDRDFRSDDEIQSLKNSGIHCIDLAEIENILLNESTLCFVADHQKLNPRDILNQVTAMTKESLSKDLDRQCSLRTLRIIENGLRKIDSKKLGESAITKMLNSIVSSIDVSKIYSSNLNLYKELLSTGSLDQILRYYNNKGLIQNACSFFQLSKNGYEKLVLRMLNSEDRDKVLTGLQKYLPII